MWWWRRRTSVLYIYRRVDPICEQYHSDGTLMIVTDRCPQDAWLSYVDRIRARREVTVIRGPLDSPVALGEPDLKFNLSGHQAEQVQVFPSGCCCDR